MGAGGMGTHPYGQIGIGCDGANGYIFNQSSVAIVNNTNSAYIPLLCGALSCATVNTNAIVGTTGTFSGAVSTPQIASNNYTTAASQTLMITDGTNNILRPPTAGGNLYYENSGGGVVGYWGGTGYIYPNGNASIYYGQSAANPYGFTCGYSVYGPTSCSLNGPIYTDTHCAKSNGMIMMVNDGNNCILRATSSIGAVLTENSAGSPGNAYASKFNVWSDTKLKSNIKPTSHGLKTISKLKSVEFNFNTDTEEDKTIGFLADDVEKIVPELVTFEPKHGKALNYIGLIPILVNAIKELKAEIDILKTERAK